MSHITVKTPEELKPAAKKARTDGVPNQVRRDGAPARTPQETEDLYKKLLADYALQETQLRAQAAELTVTRHYQDDLAKLKAECDKLRTVDDSKSNNRASFIIKRDRIAEIQTQRTRGAKTKQGRKGYDIP